MKKITLGLCAGLLILSMAACGGNGEQNDGQGSSGNVSDSTPSGDGSSPVQSDGSGSNDAGTGSEGYDYSEGWTEEMTAVKDAVVDALGENYLPSMALMPDMLEGIVGVKSDLYDDYLAETPMISTNVDTLLIIKAKDGKVDEVEKALNDYRDAQISNTMQYPMNVPKIQASRVEKIGNYLCFVMLGGDIMDELEKSDEAAILYCQGENDRVIEILKEKLE